MSEELAWAAGFFDGEGHTGVATINKIRQNKHLHIEICQTQDGPLERFQRAVGFGKIYGPYVPKDPKHKRKPYKQYHVGSSIEAKEVINKIWPWLSIPKRTQAETAFKIFEEYQARPKAVRGPNKKPGMIAKCHPERKHEAKGMCNACYLQHRIKMRKNDQ